MVLAILKNKKFLLKNIPSSRLEGKNHTVTVFMTKMAKIVTLFMAKTAEKSYLLGPHIN